MTTELLARSAVTLFLFSVMMIGTFNLVNKLYKSEVRKLD